MLYKSKILALFLAPAFLISGTNARVEKVKLYQGVYIKANEVSPNSVFGEPGNRWSTRLSKNMETMPIERMYARVGSYRPNWAEKATLGLFNMSAEDTPHELLDEIDFYFYKSTAFSELLRLKNYNSIYKEDFEKFKPAFDAATTNGQKKDIIARYPLLKEYLLKSRLDIRHDSILLDQTRTAKLTAELKGAVKNLKVQGVDMSAAVKAYLSNLTDEAFRTKGVYHTANLRTEYITTIDHYLKSTPIAKYGNDAFATNLKRCLQSTNSAINSQIVAIELNGTFNKKRVTESQIVTDLTGKLAIPAQDAAAIAAAANFTLTKKVERLLTTEFNTATIIRYSTTATVDDWELPK